MTIIDDQDDGDSGSDDNAAQDALVDYFGDDDEGLLEHALLFEKENVGDNISYEDLMQVSFRSFPPETWLVY